MNSQEIEYILKSQKSFGCVLARDELYKIPIGKTNLKNSNKSYIINTDNHNEQGCHWLSMRITPNAIYFFDSFGVSCANFITDFAKERNIKNIYYNNIQLQKLEEQSCGSWSISFVKADVKSLKEFREFVLRYMK